MSIQNTIRTNIISVVDALSTIHKTGTYPDEVARIGQNFPSVMVGDGNEIWEGASSDRELIAYSIPVYVYHNVITDRVSEVNNVTTEVIKAILSDLTLGGVCINTVVENVEKNEYSEEEDYYNPGFYPSLTVRRINLIINYYDCRNS